jgi:hypothetical protein
MRYLDKFRKNHTNFIEYCVKPGDATMDGVWLISGQGSPFLHHTKLFDPCPHQLIAHPSALEQLPTELLLNIISSLPSTS